MDNHECNTQHLLQQIIMIITIVKNSYNMISICHSDVYKMKNIAVATLIKYSQQTV